LLLHLLLSSLHRHHWVEFDNAIPNEIEYGIAFDNRWLCSAEHFASGFEEHIVVIVNHQ